ncbi:MAG: hypothetical protein CMI33_01575, partial [Opitutales bacterium]|nr:hypothetical protein [Opitutales bacterium]
MYCFLHTILKRQAMVYFFLVYLVAGLVGVGFGDSLGNPFQRLGPAGFSLSENNESHVFITECGARSESYHKALDRLIGGFELSGQVQLGPERFPKIAIKL